jgi:tight adherence protein C
VINPALTGLAAVCCFAAGARGVAMMRTPSAIERRELIADVREPERRRGLMRPLINLLGARFGSRLQAAMSERRRQSTVRRLDLAGRPGGMGLEAYMELKAGLLALGVAMALLLGIAGSWPAALLWLVCAWLAPEVWLSRSGRLRQDQLERDMPDFIDILAITVRAGTGYRAALHRVAMSLSGPAAEEILATLRQMDLGATRREAFQKLRERNNSGTLDNFVAAQLQAEELGTPLADALASIAADTRRMAAQTARRRAQRAATRITLTAIALLLPATMILIVVGMYLGSGIHIGNLIGGGGAQ